MTANIDAKTIAIAQAIKTLLPDDQGLPAVHHSRFVTIPLAAACTGYTVRAIENKVEKGEWVEGGEYVRAPDGRLLVDMKGFEEWVAKARGSRSGKRASASRSHPYEDMGR